jgi:hypothetical protein
LRTRSRWRPEKIGSQSRRSLLTVRDPSLAEGVDTRCPDGSADDLEPLDHEHLIERTAELGVAVMDEKPQRIFSFVEVKREVSRLLGHPSSGLAVQPVRCTRLVASSMNTGT